ncbi:MAG: hypothetical protein ACE5FL_00985 [Myxococcota bacterium]
MKLALAIAMGWLLLVPAPASALNPSECARLLKQIHHLNSMHQRAEARGNEMWSGRMQFQADLLRERYDDRCEGFAEDDRALRAALEGVAMVLKTGAKAAAKFFTLGAF